MTTRPGGALEAVKRPLRRLAYGLLHGLRGSAAGRAGARFARAHLPGPYAAVLRRYHAYSIAGTAPARPREGAFVPPRIAGLSFDEDLVARRLALVVHAASGRG